MSTDAGIIAGLSNGATATTYSAVGLLNAIVQAGVAPAAASGTGTTNTNNTTPTDATATIALQGTDQAGADTAAAVASGSGMYSSSGTVQGLASDVSANFAAALKANPALAGTVVDDSADQAIVSTLLGTA